MIKKPSAKTIYITVSVAVIAIIILIMVFSNLGKSDTPTGNTSSNNSSSSSSTDNSDNTVSYSPISSSGDSAQSTQISNLSSTVHNIPDSELTSINNMVDYTLNLNGIDGQVDDISIRDGSYSQSLIDNNRLIYQTTFIIDIPSLQQSYYVKDLYSPLPVEQSGLYDYTVQVTCPNDSQLIYSPFDCIDRISFEQTGVRK